MRKGNINNFAKICLLSFLVLPASTNYKLEGAVFGNAGGNSIGSSNYSMEANAGEINNGKIDSQNYSLGAGLLFVQTANAPTVTLSNPANYYNRLLVQIDPQGNPADAVFAVALSPDNFVTTYYVHSDMSLGTTLAEADFMKYELWGSAGGITINGLQPGTTYKAKAKARQGKYTESAWGPVSTAVTVNPTLTFDIDVAPTDSQTDGPYLVNLSDLNPGTLVTSNDKVWISLETNATAGASVFIYGKNAGLQSIQAGYTISAVAGDLGTLSLGYGIQGAGATQGSGGPLTLDEAYNLTASNVGLVDTSVRQLFAAAAPVTAGRGSFVVKAKSDTSTPAAADYSEIMTVVAAANF